MNKERNNSLGGQGINNSGFTREMSMNNGSNGTSRRGMNGTVNQNGRRGISEDLLEAIRELGFVKVELEEYLDTHPYCKTAIDYYHQTIDALNALMEQYHSANSPIIASGSTNTEAWDWVNTPWPWHRGDEKMIDNMGMKEK